MESKSARQSVALSDPPPLPLAWWMTTDCCAEDFCATPFILSTTVPFTNPVIVDCHSDGTTRFGMETEDSGAIIKARQTMQYSHKKEII